MFAVSKPALLVIAFSMEDTSKCGKYATTGLFVAKFLPKK